MSRLAAALVVLLAIVLPVSAQSVDRKKLLEAVELPALHLNYSREGDFAGPIGFRFNDPRTLAQEKTGLERDVANCREPQSKIVAFQKLDAICRLLKLSDEADHWRLRLIAELEPELAQPKPASMLVDAYVDALLETKRDAALEQKLQAFMLRFPDEPSVRMIPIRELMDRRAHAAAEGLLRMELAAHPDNAKAWETLASVLRDILGESVAEASRRDSAYASLLQDAKGVRRDPPDPLRLLDEIDECADKVKGLRPHDAPLHLAVEWSRIMANLAALNHAPCRARAAQAMARIRDLLESRRKAHPEDADAVVMQLLMEMALMIAESRLRAQSSDAALETEKRIQLLLIAAEPSFKRMSANAFFGMLNPYGQFMARSCPDKVMALLDEARRRDAAHPYTLNLAMVLLGSKESLERLESLVRDVLAKEENPRARFVLVRIAEIGGQPEAMRRETDELRRLHPGYIASDLITIATDLKLGTPDALKHASATLDAFEERQNKSAAARHEPQRPKPEINADEEILFYRSFLVALGSNTMKAKQGFYELRAKKSHTKAVNKALEALGVSDDRFSPP